MTLQLQVILPEAGVLIAPQSSGFVSCFLVSGKVALV